MTTENEPIYFSSEDTDADTSVIIPINAAIRIFLFVTPDDLENCKLVCKAWKKVIDYADKQLPKRKIDALVLSTNREYSATLYNGKVKRMFFYRKYFTDRDIDEIEIKQIRKISGNFDEYGYQFPCGDQYPRIANNKIFKPVDVFHHRMCKNVPPVIYKIRGPYSKKLFTPPLAYYERLKKMLHKGEIKRLIFYAFTFTELFMEKFLEYLKLETVDSIVMHGCNFRYITPQSLHALLDGIKSKEYYIEKARYCVPNHFGASLLEKPSIQMASIFCLDFAVDRRTGDPLICPIDDEILTKFMLNHIRNLHFERKFFGIALSRVTRNFIAQYQKMALSTFNSTQPNKPFYQQNTKENENDSQTLNGHWLYKHILFGELRCILTI